MESRVCVVIVKTDYPCMERNVPLPPSLALSLLISLTSLLDYMQSLLLIQITQ